MEVFTSNAVGLKMRSRHRTVQQVQERRARERNERTTENDHIQPTNANTNTNKRNATSSETQLCRSRRHPELRGAEPCFETRQKIQEHVLSSDVDSQSEHDACHNWILLMRTPLISHLHPSTWCVENALPSHATMVTLLFGHVRQL